jgi:hypothetical protein
MKNDDILTGSRVQAVCWDTLCVSISLLTLYMHSFISFHQWNSNNDGKNQPERNSALVVAKVKLCLCLIKHYAMKVCGGVEV